MHRPKLFQQLYTAANIYCSNIHQKVCVLNVTHTFQCDGSLHTNAVSHHCWITPTSWNPTFPSNVPLHSIRVGGRYSKLCKFIVTRMGDTVLLCEVTSPPWSYILHYCEASNTMVPQTRQLHWLNRQSPKEPSLLDHIQTCATPFTAKVSPELSTR